MRTDATGWPCPASSRQSRPRVSMPGRALLAGWLACVLGVIGSIVPMQLGAVEPLPTLERVTVLTQPKTIANFTLTDQHGRSRSLESLRGAPVLVFFGFTHCPDVCPAALAKLRMLRESGDGDLAAARVVLVSVDGERDTPTVMKRYLAPFPADFIGLTGPPRTVADIAARFAAVAFKEAPDPSGDYGYYHSSQVYLLDASGRLRASFSDASVENMALVTRRVLQEGRAPKRT